MPHGPFSKPVPRIHYYCGRCGIRFAEPTIDYYDKKLRKHICPACVAKMSQMEKAVLRISMRQGYDGMALKLVVAAFLLYFGLIIVDDTRGKVLLGIIVTVIVLTALVPFVRLRIEVRNQRNT